MPTGGKPCLHYGIVAYVLYVPRDSPLTPHILTVAGPCATCMFQQKQGASFNSNGRGVHLSFDSLLIVKIFLMA